MMASFQKIFHYKSETVFGAGLLMSLLTFLGSLLGFVRNALLASRFGASHTLDVYYASFRLPDLIYNIFIIGAISAAFIPLFNEYLTKDKNKAWQFANFILIVIGIFLSFLGVLVIFFARPLLSRILIGFDASNLSLVVLLTRLMMLQPLLLGISSVISGILRSFRMFFITALAPLMYNIGIIIGILVFVPQFGLKGLAFGVVFGAFLHLLVQLPALLDTNFKIDFNFIRELRLFALDFQKFLMMMSSRTSSIIISQLFLLGITSLTTLLKSGTLTIFSFVDSILPYTTFALPFADAAFPRLSRLEAENKQDEFFEVFSNTLQHILFFLLPLTCWFIIFREPFVRLLLGYGKFNWDATRQTMQVLAIMSLGMIFQSINYFFLKVFFAKKDARHPFWASLLAYSLGFLICWLFSLSFQTKGLAWGIVLTYVLYSIFLTLFLHQHLSATKQDFEIFFLKVQKMISASLISGVIGYLIWTILVILVPPIRVFFLAFDTGIACLLSLIVFISLAFKFEIKEIYELKTLLLNKMYGKRS